MIPSIRPLRSIVGTVSVLCYLATQCAFAYQPEKTFWAQRRKSAQGLTLTRNGSVKVFESSGLFPPGAVSSLSPLSSPVWGKTVPAGFLKHHRDLFAALPPSAGSVRKVALPKPGSPPGPVIVHIQDVHMNQDAQKNIGAVVGSLMKAGRVNLVALEGSTEEINLQPFADSPHRKAAEMTADYLLQENKISGPIHAAITHSGPLPRILGVDDPAHYQANVQAYLDSVPQREKAQRDLKTRQWEIDDRKKTVYSPALLAFDSVVAKYRNGELSLGEYMEILRETTGLSSNPKGHERVGDFLNAYRTERSLDFKRVELERGQLIEKLTQSLTKTESDELLAHGVAHRSGQLRSGEFYSYLVKLCGTKGLRLTAYPAMDAYVRYLLKADGIDGERLLEEMADLEKEGYALLAKTPEEKDLMIRARRAWLTGKLLDFSLIPAEWKEYQGGLRSDSLRAFEAFYEQAQARDRAMVENVFRSMSAPSVPGQVVLLVTGGFHAAGMTDLLTHRGATVVSYVPKIEKIDTAQGSAYLSVFTQEKTPLEKLAQGEKLFLAANPLSRSTRSTLLPALFAMVAVSLAGTALGFDANIIYNTVGGIGVLALTHVMGDKVKAHLKIGKSVINLDLRKDSSSVQSTVQTPSRILSTDQWIVWLYAGLLGAGVFFLGGGGLNGFVLVGVLSAGFNYYQANTTERDVLGPLIKFLPSLSPDESIALRWLVSRHLRTSSYFEQETISDLVTKAKSLASDTSLRLNALMGYPEIGGKIQIYTENGLSETRLQKIHEEFGYPIIDHHPQGQIVQTILLPPSLTAKEAARIASEVLVALKREWPNLIVEHQITIGGTYPETVRYLALLHWMTGRHIFKPLENPFHYPGDAPGIVIKGADIEQASPFHPERKPGERIDFRGRAFVLSSVNDDVLRRDLEADLAFIQLGGLAATKSEIPTEERKEWEESLARLFKKLVKQINQAVAELAPLAGKSLIDDKPWVADKNKSTWDQTVFPALKELANRLTSSTEVDEGNISRNWFRTQRAQFTSEAISVVKAAETIEAAKGTIKKDGNSGSATGWIGVGVAYGVGWAWGGLKKILGVEFQGSVRDFAVAFVKKDNGRRAAIAEDVISTLVAVAVGVWVLSILGPSMTLNWKLFFPFYVAIVWPYLLFRSHEDTEGKLRNTFGFSPGIPKALMLSGIVFCFTVVVSLIFVALRVQFPLVAEFMIPLFGGASFFVLRAFHKDLNEGKFFQSDDKKVSTVIIPLAILGALGFFPEWAEAAVRTGQIVSHGSIATFLFLILAYLVAQVVSLMRLNNSSTRLIRPTEAKAPDVEAPPLDDPAPSIEDRADEETRNAFHRFAVTVGIDPKSARFAPLRVVKGKTGYFERVIFVGGRQFVGLAVINGDSASARIVVPPMSHPSSEHKTQEADLPLPVAPARSVEHFDKGMLIDEPHESATSMASLLRTGFFNYAARNNVDIRGAKISPVRSENSNQASLAVYVGARRYIVEAIRHYSIIGGNIRSRTEVSVSDGDDPLYKKWMAQRSAKEKAERERERLNMWLPPLNSVVRPNNILFLLTGKHPVAGFVIDAVFLLGAAASGAMMGILLPAFALLHVALEWRKDPGREIKAGFIRFVSHLVFALPYAFLDFSGGIYSLGAWIGAAVAVGIHGAYDAFAIGLSDGRDATKLARGSASERLAVLLGRPVSLSESFKGEILSTSPDLFRRLANEKQSNLYKIGVKIGAAQYKGRSDLVPVIEMPVSNEIELRELLLFIDKVGNLNRSNPDQQRFITVTPQGDMTADQVNTALSRLNIGTFVFVKNLSGPISFNDYEKEFGLALAQFGLDPKNMFLILAGRPDIGDLESIRSEDKSDSELRKTLREVLFSPCPVISTVVILEMLNAISVAAKNA